MSPCVGSLTGTAYGSRSFFHRLNSHWFLQPEVVGTYLPGTGTLGWWPCVDLGLLSPKISLPNFYPPQADVGPTCSVSVSFLPVWMDVVSSVLVKLPFNLISDGSEG